jgi:hypothetical protein
MPGHLDGQDLCLALAQGDQLHNEQRLAVLVGPWLLGVERQDRLRLQGAQERDRGRVHRKLHVGPSFSGRSGSTGWIGLPE